MEEDAVVGVTSNPTIFQKALAEGDWYDEQLQAVSRETDDPTEIFIALAQEDIRDACDLMAPVWERTNGVDGFVSLEVDPRLAYDRVATYDQAMRFHEEVDRKNLYVKIPGTEPGLGAIEDCIAEGALHQRDADLLARPVPRRRRGVPARPRAARGGGRRPRLGHLRRELLRVSRGHGGGPEARGGGAHRPPGQARRREREARVRALAGGVLGRPVGVPRGQGRTQPALPLGVDVDEEPRLPRRALRRGPDRPGDRQHDAAGDRAGLPGPRRGARHADGGRATRHMRCSTSSPRPGSTTTTWSRRWRTKECGSSPTRSTSSARASPRSCASSRHGSACRRRTRSRRGWASGASRIPARSSCSVRRAT